MYVTFGEDNKTTTFTPNAAFQINQNLISYAIHKNYYFCRDIFPGGKATIEGNYSKTPTHITIVNLIHY